MSYLKSAVATLAFAAGLSALPVAAVQAADPTGGYYEDATGICGQPGVLNRIRRNFRYQVRHVPNLPDVEIVGFHNVHEHRYIPAGEDRPIARRFCGATAQLSDGSSRETWYLIEEGMGFSTLLDGFHLANETRGSNVEFCVSGFDRWMVYNGACRVLR